jgi:hypothetical protein
MTRYDCMSPAELDAWMEAAARVRNGGSVPCFDCPRWFAEQARSAGCCEREPQVTGRPAHTPDERRAQWREAARRLRRRRKLAQRNRIYRANLRAQVEAVRMARAA